MKAIGNRIFTVICAFFLVIALCICYPVSAAESKGTLALWCVNEKEIVEGMQWRIYRVGHRNENDYVFEGAFSQYRPTLGDKTKSMLEWKAAEVAAAADTLRVYTILDKIPSIGEGVTDAQGNLNFTGLENGLYLVIGDRLQKGTKIYTPSAIFFEMNGQTEAELNAFPKIVLETLDDKKADYSVKKVWLNDKNQPPDLDTFITCEIYCDSVLHETVRLDQSNDWTYEWSDKADHQWLVKEKVIPQNYTVTYQDNHYQYLILNTLNTPKDDSSVTDIHTTTAPVSTTDTQTTSVTEFATTAVQETGTTPRTTSETVQTSTTETVTTTVATPTPPPGDTPKLPQTGQLWWPVPVLCAGGLSLFAAGAWLRKKDEK